MAGRTPDAARQRFLEPLRALSCVTSAQRYSSPAAHGEVEALVLSDDPILLGDSAGGTFELILQQQYEVVRTDDRRRGPYKVSTRAYWYEVRGFRDGHDRIGEWIGWHLHASESERRPHLHVQHGPLAHLHIPTGRTSIESVLRFLLTALRVVPRRGDLGGRSHPIRGSVSGVEDMVVAAHAVGRAVSFR